MRKILVFFVLSFLTMNVFCFDYDKDNFSVSLDLETGLFFYEENIYILGYDGKLWKDKRPEKLTDEYGYSSIKLNSNPYYGNSVEKEKSLYFLDLRGDCICYLFWNRNMAL